MGLNRTVALWLVSVLLVLSILTNISSRSKMSVPNSETTVPDEIDTMLRMKNRIITVNLPASTTAVQATAKSSEVAGRIHTENKVSATTSNTKPNDDPSKNRAVAGEFILVREINAEFQNLTLNQAEEKIFKHITTMTGSCSKTHRFGRKGDGGYTVCMDHPFAPEKDNCLVYSFGIRNEWSFDDDMSSNHGCEVHSFDPSMTQPDHMHSAGVRFHRLGIWGSDVVNEEKWNLMSFGTIIKFLGHENRVIDYLKIDVEGAEWPALQEMLLTNSTNSVKQMIFEIHTPKFKENPMTLNDFGQVYDDLTALQNQLGFRLYMEKHTNGCCGRFARLATDRKRTLCCFELFYINSRFSK